MQKHTAVTNMQFMLYTEVYISWHMFLNSQVDLKDLSNYKNVRLEIIFLISFTNFEFIPVKFTSANYSCLSCGSENNNNKTYQKEHRNNQAKKTFLLKCTASDVSTVKLVIHCPGVLPIKSEKLSQIWGCIPIISALWSLSQEDCHTVKATAWVSPGLSELQRKTQTLPPTQKQKQNQNKTKTHLIRYYGISSAKPKASST